MNVRLKDVFLPLLLLIAVFTSCYPVDDDLTAEDLDVVASIYSKTYYSSANGEELNKFEYLQTFIVLDTVVHVIDEDGTDEITRLYDDFVLDQVKYNMLKNGFTEELNPAIDTPDVVLTLTVMSSEHDVYYWYPYWGWYWGYSYSYSDENYNTYWNDYYYPWAGYENYYTYKSGTILIEMVDVALINPENEQLPIIWAGIVNGALQDSHATTKTRLQNAIDQCFVQSPYLLKESN